MDKLIGNVDPPLTGGYSSLTGGAIGLFITNILRLLFAVAGVVMLFNLIFAGYTYMTAAGDPKKLAQAWSRIWLCLVGLLIVVGSFAIAAAFGYLLFGDAGFIFSPQIYGPND